MSKRKPNAPASPPAAQTAATPPNPSSSQAAIRETVESIVIAVALAFLLRTFQVEAFVIPTGSMAPTLMGRHKDLYCPKCGEPYQISASEEVTEDGKWRGESTRIVEGTCPMCRFTANVGPGNPQHETYPSYSGDRVLVNKFAYEFSNPQRWDIVVFKYPGNASVNFIKRLIGLPGETVRIQHGDIWISRDGQSFAIARKPPAKLVAMLQPVFDNDDQPKIAGYGWPSRWLPEASAADQPPGDNAPNDSASGNWRAEEAAFAIDGANAAPHWLRYHHRIPSYALWKADRDGFGIPAGTPQPQLIKDFTAYDTGIDRREMEQNPAPPPGMLGQHWVGDLALALTVDVGSDAGRLLFELRKGGRAFQCNVDVATGRAVLSISGADRQDFAPAAVTRLRGKGRHTVRFSNCDNELRLWVDEAVVAFDAPTTYDDLDNWQPAKTDLTPVGVAAQAAAVRISHVRVLRDIYYIAVSERNTIGDQESLNVIEMMRPDESVAQRQEAHTVDFPLAAGQFFMLGDNSARSKDGRLWGEEYWVDRDLLIGKAIFVYWPHSWDGIPMPWFNIPFPYFPNFQNMRLVR